MDQFLIDSITYLAAFLLGSAGTARMVRLFTQDDFPPVTWLRVRWVVLTRGGTWSDLAECPWCLAPWFALVNVAYAYGSDLHWSWWLCNVVAASAYLASWIVVHDED